MRLLHRTQHQLGVAQLEILAVVIHLLARPQQPHRLQTLQIATHPGTSGHAEIVILLIPVAQRRAQGELAAGNYVHRSHPLGQVHRMVQGHQHRRHQPHAARLGGDAGQQRHRLQLLVRVGQVVLTLIDQVKPQVARRTDVGADVGECLLHIGADRLLGDGGKGHAKLHRNTSASLADAKLPLFASLRMLFHFHREEYPAHPELVEGRGNLIAATDYVVVSHPPPADCPAG